MGVVWEPLHYLVRRVLGMWCEGVSHRSLRIWLQREDLDSGLCARDIASFFSPTRCYIQKRIFLPQSLFMKGVGLIFSCLWAFSFMPSYTRWWGLKNHITGGLSIAQSSVALVEHMWDNFQNQWMAFLVCIKSEWIIVCQNTYFGFVFLTGDCNLRARWVRGGCSRAFQIPCVLLCLLFAGRDQMWPCTEPSVPLQECFKGKCCE